MEFLTPPPVRWLDAGHAPAPEAGPATGEEQRREPATSPNGNGHLASFVSAPRRRAPASQFAIASVLLVSAMALSLAGWAAKQPLKRYAAA